MKSLLRPLFVGAISIAIAATSVVGSSFSALAAPPPLIVSWELESPIYEGARPILTGTFGGGGVGVGPYTVDVDWYGDQVLESYSIDTPAVGGSFTVQKTQPYLNELPPFTIVVFLSDRDVTARRTIQNVTVLNAPPSFESFGVSPTNPETDQAVTFSAQFTDSGANDTLTVTLDWGDGTDPTTTDLGLARSFTSDAHSYGEVRDYIVTATLTDNAGGSSAPATVTVTVHAPNQAPDVISFGVTPGPEGGTTSLALTFADADAADTHTVSVAWGDSSSDPEVTLAAGETTFSATHVYADMGTYPLVLTLKDSATPAHTVTRTSSVSPTNVSPSVGALTLSPSPVVDHQELTVSGTFTDPGTSETFTLQVVWGDGTPSTDMPLGTEQSFSATHVYDAAGPVTITATVTDANGGNGSSTANLIVGSSNQSASELLNEMSALVLNFGLDRNAERWLLKKIDDTQASLAYGNDQVCSSSGTFAHLMSYAERTLTTDEFAALSGLATQLEAAAGCAVGPNVHPNGQPAKKRAASAGNFAIQ
jgi:hypothetical protein